jgi:hypothetical protein
MTLDAAQVFGMVIKEDIDVHDMVHGSRTHMVAAYSSRQSLRSVKSLSYLPPVFTIFGVGQGVQTEDIAADSHSGRVEFDILQTCSISLRQGEVFFEKNKGVMRGGFGGSIWSDRSGGHVKAKAHREDDGVGAGASTVLAQLARAVRIRLWVPVENHK